MVQLEVKTLQRHSRDDLETLISFIETGGIVIS